MTTTAVNSTPAAHEARSRPDAEEPPIARLRQIMVRLRDPESGCAWDIAQNFSSVAPYTIEEAYEVVDAIERGDFDDLRDELGDLLLQVVFHAQMANEEGRFDFDDVAIAICEKLVRRHPHIFGDGAARTPEEIKRVWDDIKAEEKAGKPAGLIEDVPVNAPSLVRAQKLQKRVAKAGLDWPDISAVAEKLKEEMAEFEEAAARADTEAMKAEFGDLMFTLVNIARHAGIDADEALRATNAKFAARVRHIESAARAEGIAVDTLSAEEWDQRWERAKRTVG
ncbi:MAG: nucleoside triphosphate pyrophosphohydrolase [Pseudomonadota bacterium]